MYTLGTLWYWEGTDQGTLNVYSRYGMVLGGYGPGYTWNVYSRYGMVLVGYGPGYTKCIL